MTTQSEAQLEVALIRQLVGQGFRLASIQDGDDLLLNLKEELEAFNGHRYSDREFKKVLNHLSKGNFFTKAENLPLIHDVDAIPDEFDRYVQQEKTLALGRICEEEKLDREQFSALMESYIYSNQEPIRDDILQCLGDRPSVLQARRIGERILDRMRDFVSTFVEVMVGKLNLE